ncbi:MAG TPA: RNA polymerase sigma-70 factor [Cyclobacteriaceae bacterium]
MPELLHHKDDNSLLESLRSGDEVAFQEIFKKYWQLLYKTALLKVRSREEAEEIVQSIFTSLWEKRQTLLITNLEFYLKTAVRNRVINTVRSKITQEKYWRYYRNFIPFENESVEDILIYNELSDSIQTAVNSLPEKSKRVFKLSRFEGRSISEIANMLKVSEKAIEYHLTKSIKTLRVHLKDMILLILLYNSPL